MSGKPLLKLDWCSHEAAKYAVAKWHYSGTLSSSKNVYIGVWEIEKFIGVIVFGIGAGNVTNGTKYGLSRTCEMAEMTRVALANHHKSPVSRIVSIAIRMMKRQSPGVRLIISMSDPVQGHVGGIYQAGGWIYTGTTAPDVQYFFRGQWRHHRTVTNSVSATGLKSRPLPGKHRYLMPLDPEMRVRILPLSKPYPKRATGVDSDPMATHAIEGGANPTVALLDNRQPLVDTEVCNAGS